MNYFTLRRVWKFAITVPFFVVGAIAGIFIAIVLKPLVLGMDFVHWKTHGLRNAQAWDNAKFFSGL